MSSDSSSPEALNKGSAPVVVAQPPSLSLDGQILAAEAAVMQRDRGVREGLVAIGQKSAAVGTGLGIALVVGAGGLALGWLATRQRAAPALKRAVPQVRRRASLALVRGAAWLWPLLPLALKSRLSDTVLRSLLKVAKPPLLGSRVKARVEDAQRKLRR